MKLATAGAFLAFGLMTGAGAVAQQGTPTEAANQATEAPQAVAATTDDDGGFDDWGLAGLLGLLGLAGLRKGETETRTVEQREERVVNPVDATRTVRPGDVADTRTVRTDDIDPRR